MNARGRVGGILVRVDGALRFISAAVALRVAPPPRVTPLPGAPSELVGIAMHQGAIVPVVAIGSMRGEMIVCEHASELIGLVGGEVVATGLFDVSSADPVVVEHEGARAESLDVTAIYSRVQSSARPGRWGR